MINLFKSSENLPKYGKTKVNSRLGNMKLRTFLIKKLIPKLINTLICKVFGLIIVSILTLKFQFLDEIRQALSKTSMKQSLNY